MRTGGFALVSGAPAGSMVPIRLAALPSMFDPRDYRSGGFLLYADDGSALNTNGWTAYLAREGAPLTSLSIVEWVRPTSAALLAAAARTAEDAEYNGHVQLFAPGLGEPAIGIGAGSWLTVATPTTGHTDDSWLTETAPAMVAGSYGSHGSLELCLAVRDHGFRHLYADATAIGRWTSSGLFSTAYHFDGIALAEDTFSNHLLLVGVAGSNLILSVRDDSLRWGTPRIIWSAPVGTQFAGVPALWQEQVPPRIAPSGITSVPGDFFIAVGVSDGSTHLLRLPYSRSAAVEVSAAAPPIPPMLWPAQRPLESGQSVPAGEQVQEIVAVALAQSPPPYPAIPWSEFASRSIELYCFYGAGSYNATWFTLDDGAWSSANLIPSGVAPRIGR